MFRQKITKFCFLLFILLQFLLSSNEVLAATCGAYSDWYNCGWASRVKVTVAAANVNSDLTDFPIYVDLSDLPSVFFSSVQTDGDDIRVTKSDGTTEVAYELVNLTTGSSTGELHFIASGTLSSSSDNEFYIYYGNGSTAGYAATDTYGSENVWNSNYKLVMHMNDVPTGTVYDSTDNSNDGTPTGMAAGNLVTGSIGKAIDFQVNDYLTVTHNSSIDFTSDYTISAYIDVDSGGAIRGILEKVGGSPWPGYTYCAQNATSKVRTYNNNTGWVTSTSLVFNYSSSNYVAYKVDADSGITYVVDSDSEFKSDTISGPTSTTTNLKIGSCYQNNYLYGRIDELRMANVALSNDWLSAEFMNLDTPGSFYSVSAAVEWNDVTAPTISSTNPADNGTILVSSNITITFSESIDVATGNLTILKLADDSVFEAIDITSGQITGNGTATLTINPSSDLSLETEYYIKIDATAIDDLSGNNFAGISDNGTWNFSTPVWMDSNWAYRIPITIDSTKVNGDLTNFPVYVDLSDLDGTGFFANVQSDGDDIRVTKSDGNGEVAFELVSINTGTPNGGELHFVANGTLSSTTDTTFYIYYGNPSASSYGVSDTYGRNNVWMNNFVLVLHLEEDGNTTSGGYIDSSSNDYPGTGVSMTPASDVSAQLGKGQEFDGAADYISFGNFSGEFSTTATFTIWLKKDCSSCGGSDNTGFGNFGTHGDNDHYTWGDDFYTDIFRNDRVLVGTHGTRTVWHHLAVVNRGSGASDYEVHYNGEQVTIEQPTGSQGESSIYMSTTPRLGLGNSAYSYKAYYYDGYADELRIASTSRSVAWIQTEYKNQSSSSTFYSVGSQESLPDVTAPTVSTFSPADNATGVAVDANLVITFDEAVNVGTGNLTILTVTGDTVFEAIDITSGQVTGGGTTTLTINPGSDLDAGTEYYVTIAATAVDDTSGNSFAGIADKTTWNFTTDSGSTPWFSTNWPYRLALTVDSNYVNGDLTDFPVYVDMSDFPAAFFTNVNSDGGDIRVTTENGKPCALEVVTINTSGSNGEMYFKAPFLSGSTNTAFWVYYGNSSASMLNGAHNYGSQNVWSNGYVAVYHMQEDPSVAGALIKDSTSYRNHGTPGGSMTSGDLVAGKLGNGYALDFDGSNDGVNLGNDSSFTFGTGDMTLSAWVYPYSTASYDIILGKDVAGDRDWAFGYGATANRTGFYEFHGSGNIVAGTNDIAASSWYNVFFTRVSGYGYLYNNSSLKASHATTVNDNFDQTGDLYIGQREYSGFQQYLGGRLDEIRIANKTRTAEWIDTVYNNQNSPSTFYTISGSAETTAVDSNPKVQSYYPATASTHFPLQANLVMVFDENVTADTGNVTIHDASDDSTFDTISCGALSISSATVTINPSTDFSADTTYYVNIPATCLHDASSNYYVGISDKFTWRFTVQGSKGPHPIFFDNML